MGDGTFRAMAARMGASVSDLADAEPWPDQAVRSYAEKHGKRDGPLGPHRRPDVQVASAVRMLTRQDLDHEAVVCAARDCICALWLTNDRLVRALTAMLEETEGTVTAENRGLGLARYQALEAVEAATGKTFMPSRRSA